MVVVARLERQLVVERDGLKDCAQLVIAVGAAAQDVKPPVNLSERGERESGHRHDGRLTSLVAKRQPPGCSSDVAGALNAS